MTDIGQPRANPRLYLDAESKTSEALASFKQLPECTYQYKLLGDSGQNENMTCDCHETWDPEANINRACDEDSGCINRATSVECVKGACLCGNDCQNQRFQNKAYAEITVFQTEKKGYGVRADSDLHEGTFIYEYIGEVIDETLFRKRMVEYDSRNLKHFYFMMLKKDAFIDATSKGALARFVNHSCNPNAYVDKWVVGDKLRMGIFAKRFIRRGEEITFDYNVDRYGAQSQPCYCGEPNCIKFMGGRTQTDAALLLPDGISEALGVSLQEEKAWLKQNKHLRTKQQKDDSIINEMFVKFIEVSGLEEADVTRVMAALMKTQDLQINKKLIERIFLTNDENVNLQIVKMHGYKTLSTILKAYGPEDNDIVEQILTILSKWPKMTRNKISSSQIEDVVKDIASGTDSRHIRGLAKLLLDEWSKLQMAYRIPKKLGSNSTEYVRNIRSNSPESHTEPEEELLDGWEAAVDPATQKTYYFNRELQQSVWDKPVKVKAPTSEVTKAPSVTPVPKGPRSNTPYRLDELRIAELENQRLQKEKELLWQENLNKQKSLQDLILQSQKQAEEKKALEEKMKQELADKARNKAKAKSKAKSKSKSTSTNIDKKWSGLFAQYVPNFIKKYGDEIGRDNVKECARDVVKILVGKEMAKDPKRVPPSEFDKGKLKRIKSFTDGYMEKFLTKYREKHLRKHKHELQEEPHKRTKTE